MKYVVVLDRAERNWAAWSLEITGCVATGSTPEETLKGYEKSLRMHL